MGRFTTQERHRPDWALAVADRWRQLRARDPAHEPSVQEWRLYQDLLQTLWRDYADLNASAQQRLVAHLQAAWPQLDDNWRGQMGDLQREHPANAGLHYLAGLLCRQRQDMDAASQHLSQAAATLSDAALRRRAWRVVAELAQERGDSAAAVAAWQQAAQD